MISTLLLVLLGLLPQVFSHRTVELDWDITWVTASPDGFSRPVVGINNRFPCPTINVNLGDRLIIHVTNRLGNETTSIHFHGLYQTGTNAMDGPVGVTQCPVTPDQTITYDFIVSQTGTYWYHAHNSGQYIDGLRGAFVVRDPTPPFRYDEDITITLSDWYQQQAPGLINYFQSPDNLIAHDGAEPIPNSALMLDTQNAKIAVKAKKTYMIRIINISSFVGSYIKIDGHDMTIVEIDGIYIEPKTVDMLYVTAAQRYSVLVTMKPDSTQNFAISSTLDTAMFDVIPPWVKPDVFGYLMYNNKKPLPTPTPLRNLTQIDDLTLIPRDAQLCHDKVDRQIMMVMDFKPINGVNRAVINDVTYVPQKVPALFTALSAPAQHVTNPLIYGVNSNPYVLKYDDVIEIVLINNDNGHHPWHLHGHAFQVIARSPSNTPYNPAAIVAPKSPMRRDTIQVHSGGYVVLRFKANNPGIFLFHCHIEWHMEAGLIATMIEAPERLAQTQSIPRDHLKVCRSQGLPTKGNAAGNTSNWLDLTGAPTQFKTNPWGALINPPTITNTNTNTNTTTIPRRARRRITNFM